MTPQWSAQAVVRDRRRACIIHVLPDGREKPDIGQYASPQVGQDVPSSKVWNNDGQRDIMTWKRLFVVLLAFGSLAAHAEWIRVSSTRQSVFYVDSSKSPRVGDNVMVWVLRDHKQMLPGQGLAVRSSKDQIEIDCAVRRVRRIFSSDHGRRMGEGPMLHSEHGPMSWNAVALNTPISRIADVACALT